MPIEMVARRLCRRRARLTLDSARAAAAGAAAGRRRCAAAGRRSSGARGGGRRGGSADRAPPTSNMARIGPWAAPADRRRARRRAEALDVTGNLVFAGNGYVINKTNTNPYKGWTSKARSSWWRDCRRNWRRNRPPVAADAAGAARNAPNPLGEACTDYWTPEQYAAKNGALAVVTVANFQQVTAMANPNAGRRGRARRPRLNGPHFQVAKFQPPAACPAAPDCHRRPGADQRAVPGREAERRAGLLRHRRPTPSRIPSSSTARKKLTIHLAVHSDAGPRRKRDRHSGRQRPGAEERVRGDERAPRSHRPERAAARRPQREQRRR